MTVLFLIFYNLESIYSGHRIGTAEVESALASHPQCAEAAVVGVEHEVSTLFLPTGDSTILPFLLKSFPLFPPSRSKGRGFMHLLL